MGKSHKRRFLNFLNLFVLLIMLAFIAGCGGSTGDDGPAPEPAVTPATLDMVASPPTVKSDNSTASTITITAKNAANAAMPGITINLTADTGSISPGPYVTGGDGTLNVQFRSGGGTTGPINRTATIAAAAGTVTAQAQVDIIGSTVTLSSTGTSLTNDGTNPITLTVRAKNAGDAGVNGAAVTLTQSSTDGGSVNFAATSGTTATVASEPGVFKTTVTGTTAGTVTIIARALNASATIEVRVDTVEETFAIDQQTLCNPGCAVIPGNPDPTAMQTGDQLQIRVNVPAAYAASRIFFNTSVGTWTGGTTTHWVFPAAGKATAELNTTQAAIANVEVWVEDAPAVKDTLTVGMSSAAAPHSIILQAAPTVVPKKTATITGTATITATVRDSSDPAVPVANVPVAFSIVNPTGGGERIEPVVEITGADGTARTIFTSGTLPSYDAGGVKIHAEVVGTGVATGVAPSGNDASIVIGGVPGSLAFGLATELVETGGPPATHYVQAVSVLVTDINGNPVQGAEVSASLRPVAWSTGTNPCMYDPDGFYVDYTVVPSVLVPCDTCGTFLSEDLNWNLILDPGEDGWRSYYVDPLVALPIPGTQDGELTPPNSAASIAPNTSPTGADGIANFNVRYPKDHSIWTVVRIRASTLVQGSETVAQKTFRLAALSKDVNPCRIPCSYTY